LGKYGKRKEIQLNPLNYNIGIAGISGVGKTTLTKEVCEKLVGVDGYIALDLGRESGHNCITGIVSETVPDWDVFADIVDDIVDNKTKDYPDLKVVILDTMDELFIMAEEEAIRLHNVDAGDKRITSINQVDGGFGRGLDKTIQLVLDKLWELKNVGVQFIAIFHTKNKEVDDVVSGKSYNTITASIMQKYFNAIKTKLDFLAVAYIDREIIAEGTGKKDIKTKKEIMRNVVVSEARRIAFRSDDYNLDSKSRFAEIVDNIPLEADAFINAMQDAILAEHAKGSKTVEQSQKEQEKAEADKLKAVAALEEKSKKDKELKGIIVQIADYIKANKLDKDKYQPLLDKTKELGFANPTTIDNIKDAKTVLSLIKD